RPSVVPCPIATSTKGRASPITWFASACASAAAYFVHTGLICAPYFTSTRNGRPDHDSSLPSWPTNRAASAAVRASKALRACRCLVIPDRRLRRPRHEWHGVLRVQDGAPFGHAHGRVCFSNF